MKRIQNFITEKLIINKATNIKYNIFQIIIDIIQPKYQDVKNYLKEWIEKEKIEDITIYVNYYAYFNVLTKICNNKSLIKYYKDINDPDAKVINRYVYNGTKNNWHFIGKDEGLGFWKNYFAYVSSNKKIFTSSPIYIVGNTNEEN